MSEVEKSKVKSIECRFAVFCQPPEDSKTDIHVVKEIVHLEDGTSFPNLRIWKDYKRPFYLTKPAYRNHESKKEWELKSRVQEYKSTQSQLINNISKALNEPWFRGNLRKRFASPYIYGADILSTSHLKREYQEKFPDITTPFKVASYDTETDVVKGTDEILMATLSCKDKVYTVIQKSFVAGLGDVENRLHQLLLYYLGEYVESRQIKWEVAFADSEADLVCMVLKKAHELKPDFLSIWNMDFDIPKTIEALKKAGMDPADIFSDPNVPKPYRFLDYKRGPSQKVTASGKITPIKPAARWHTLFCPSSFYVIDAMCAYRHIRTGRQEEPSYSLDAILQKHLGIRKLKFKEAEGKEGLAWHQFMQTKHPLEYVIYNVFDCISMEILDEKTKDLCLTLPSMSGCSDFENFKSQPRRVVDELHFFVQKSDCVIGTTSNEMDEEADEETIGLKDWIN